jgi:AraC-like DNA-binding protein
MAEGRRLSNLGPLGLLLRDAQTLGEALAVIARHVRIHNEAMNVSLEKHDGIVVLRLDVIGAGQEPVRQFTELVLAVTFRFLQTFLGAGWRPKSINFSHRKPDNLSEHRRFFGCPLSFNAECCSIVCDEHALAASNPAADPVMARYLDQVFSPLTPNQTSWEERARRCIVLLLPRGHARSDIVANHLGVSVRTLARRLDEEDWRFNALIDSVRSELVSRYLVDRSKQLGDIATLLGFSTPSSFSRWFRLRYGTSPRTSAIDGIPKPWTD